MTTLQRKYGSEHRKRVFRMELMKRSQRVDQALQRFAAEIERLAHMAYVDCSTDYIERCKIETFEDSIRDPETKRMAIISPKQTFMDTVSNALASEAASAVCRPAYKVRNLECEYHEFEFVY